MHRLGWLVGAAILVQFPYRVAALLWGGPPPWLLAVNRLLGWLLLYLLVGNWLCGLVM
jgi:hypothetical protein